MNQMKTITLSGCDVFETKKLEPWINLELELFYCLYTGSVSITI